jgi:GNAT superfamily N-acetyltransferase
LPDAPVLFDNHHDVSEFDCGTEQLNLFLPRHALANQKGGSARTYVLLSEHKVVGYYSLAPSSIEYSNAPERIVKGQAKYPVPCILLARLAVDLRFQGAGFGKFLFRNALLRAFRAHEQIGGRAFLVHALHDDARRMYEKFGMIASPTNPYHLMLLFKDLSAMLQSPQRMLLDKDVWHRPHLAPRPSLSMQT